MTTRTAMPQDRRILVAQLADANRDRAVLREHVAHLLGERDAMTAEITELRGFVNAPNPDFDPAQRVRLDAIRHLALIGRDPDARRHRTELLDALGPVTGRRRANNWGRRHTEPAA